MLEKIKRALNRNSLFYFAAAALIIQRFFHLRNGIEEPMAWRQFDTEVYAYSFFKNGIDLLKPSVCWLGSHKTLILEFPFVSAIISVFYKLFGHSVIYARIVILLFYIASAFYFYLIVKNLYNKRLAKFTLLVYLLLPMGIYYSRAVNIDFPVLFFSLGALYYYIIGFQKANFSYLVLATVFSLFGFLIKAPYQFIIYIPLLYFVIQTNKIKLFLKYLPLLILPAVVFIFWQKYTINTNASAPDWYFIPGYFKFTDMYSWYFGTLADRLYFSNWERLITRFIPEGITYIGLPFFVLGLFIKPENNRYNLFFYFYSVGGIIYLLLFFTLNLIHDYYQVPILVISSFFIGINIDFIYRKLKNISQLKANLITGFILAALIINGIWYAERWYFKIDKVRTVSAEYIRNNTADNSLVIASIDNTDPRDPRILAPAYRYGWPIRTEDLNGALIDSLIKRGSNYLAITTKEDPKNSLQIYLQSFEKQEFKIPEGDWKLLLYKLK